MDQKFSYDYTGIKFKFYAPTTIKTVKDGDEWIIKGYAATSDLDRQGDVITPEALKAAAEDLKKNTTVFYEHKHDQPPVGKVLDAGVDKGGLWVEVLISKTRADIWQLIQEGILNKFSIGGKVISSQQKSLDGINYNLITKMELFEVSIVGLPANVNATFSEKSIVWSIRKAAEKKEKLNAALEIIEGGETKVAEEKKEEKKIEEPIKEEKKEDAKVEQTGEQKETEKAIDAPVAGLEKKEEVIPAAEEKKEEVIVEKKEEVKAEEVKPELTKEEIKAEVKEEVVEKKEATVKTAEEAALAARAVAVGLPETATLAEVEAAEAAAQEPETIDLEAELNGIKATLATILTAIEALKVKAEVVPVTKEASMKIEDVQEVVVKALEEKLGKIRLVPSRKGTIVKLSKDMEEEGNEDLNTLMDETKFKALPEAKQRELIRKGLTSVILQ